MLLADVLIVPPTTFTAGLELLPLEVYVTVPVPEHCASAWLANPKSAIVAPAIKTERTSCERVIRSRISAKTERDMKETSTTGISFWREKEESKTWPASR